MVVRLRVTACALVALAADGLCGTAQAQNYTYTFTGKHFYAAEGCLTKADHLSVAMVFSAPIPYGSCNTTEPTEVTVSDGYTTASGGIDLVETPNFLICKTGKKINQWTISGTMLQQPGVPLIAFTATSGTFPQNSAGDYTCSPEGVGKGKGGKIKGP